ncbi:ATP-binding protein [bacterium]|nr:ATP-binding protein [bacterium]
MDLTPNKPSRSFPVRITCRADLAVLCELRRHVIEAAEQCGFQGEEAVKIEMAVDEACSNVAEHAYTPDEGDPTITLEIDLTPRALTIHVTDRGRGGRPEDFSAFQSIGEYCRMDRQGFSGLGLLIMKKFMDEIEVVSQPNGGTRVMMRKYRSEAA